MVEKILIVGSGAREHAIGWKLKTEGDGKKLFFAPGNCGTQSIGTNIDISPIDISRLAQFAADTNIDLTVVGPEVPLSLGIVDVFRSDKKAIFGPTESAAMLETDKAWAAEFMNRHGIPHPVSQRFTDFDKASQYVGQKGYDRIVIKAAGLASGKGVVLPQTDGEAQQVLEQMLIKGGLDAAGKTVVIQDRLVGREVSVFAFSDGTRTVRFSTASDHKRLRNGNLGPNTGGMGAIAPSPFVSSSELDVIYERIMEPTIAGMREEGRSFTGVLFAGIMLTKDGPMVLEYNVRFGDPETQAMIFTLTSSLGRALRWSAEGTGELPRVQFSRHHATAVVLASAGYPEKSISGEEIFGIATASGKNIQLFHAGTKRDGERVVTHGGRVLSVTSRGKTLGEALGRAYDVIGTGGVYFEGMQYRTDIGRESVIYQHVQ